ncbi:phospholipase D family protein [Alloalcanivorax xenomutans]|uniref:phospholipase D family protein n=1 Tax=Alloalcanivorax xenomutans TaxID=1094342 RepID=UPI001F2B8823|nr:phospholipase D family protein [Alloalcanivorax xenomutans]MCE7524357.1 phospholipase D family protein [Alloalcanivorax xenomutans]
MTRFTGPGVMVGHRLRGLMLITMLLALSGCAGLPSLEGRTATVALSSEYARTSAMGKVVTPLADAHPGKSGIHALVDAREAFAARMLLADAAEHTLDIQYYIWHADITGTLLFEALHRAADRGVRVRLLLDDNNTVGLDEILSALDAHPNIEVRLFNPFVLRWPRAFGFITDFSRANRRMHNKSFTVDNQVTVVGGRNVGDEYFGATDGPLFADLDVLAIGPVVDDVSVDFDRYWASRSSYPADRILPDKSAPDLQALAASASRMEQTRKADAYMRVLKQSELVTQLRNGNLPFEWAATRMVSDDPAKGLGEAAPEGLLMAQLSEIIGTPAASLELVSPYFVPTAAGVEAFTALAESGVDIRVLTNSLEATDVSAVHAGYAKRRKDLLSAGIQLYEMRATADSVERNKSAGPFGSSGSSLHAKTFAVDQERVFVGSFNFDPRSANLNTELGFVIESPVLAKAVAHAFATRVPEGAYQVKLDQSGDLYWVEEFAEGERLYRKEPGVGVVKRWGVSLLSWLPIEWLL